MISQIAVTLEDGQELVADVDGRDIRAWEATSKRSFLTSDVSYTSLTELARLALTRTNVITMSKTDFDSKCVEVKEVAREADPT